MARAASLWAGASTGGAAGGIAGAGEDDDDDEGTWTPTVFAGKGTTGGTTAGAAAAAVVLASPTMSGLGTPAGAAPASAGGAAPWTRLSAGGVTVPAPSPTADGDEDAREDDVLGLAYDEDLADNLFLKTLQTKHAKLWAQATEQLCTVCVPCGPSLEGLAMTADEFESHLLVRPKSTSSDEYRTLNNKMVRLERAYVKTLAAFRAPRRLRILFEETYYNAQNQSYRVLCLEGPLEGGVALSSAAQAAFGSVAVQLRTIADCRAYLWADTAAMDGRQAVDDAIAAAQPALDAAALQSVADVEAAVGTLYDRTLPVLLKGLPPRASREPALKFVRLAYETHLLAKVHETVFGRLGTLCATDDSSFNKITRNLADLAPVDLGLPLRLAHGVPRAAALLSRLASLTSPLEKILCLKRAVKALSRSPTPSRRPAGAAAAAADDSGDDGSSAISSDELIPLLMLAVVRSEETHWSATLAYVDKCRVSGAYSGDIGFFLASYTAAVQQLRETVVASTLPDPATGAVAVSKESADAALFAAVATNRLDDVRALLTQGNLTVDVESLMCHPLCECAKCQALLAQAKSGQGVEVRAASATVYARDANGRTPLHTAARWQHPDMVIELLAAGALINARDGRGRCALHAACQYGTDGTTILALLKAGADPALDDEDGNTPLHLAVLHGRLIAAHTLLQAYSPATAGRADQGAQLFAASGTRPSVSFQANPTSGGTSASQGAGPVSSSNGASALVQRLPSSAVVGTASITDFGLCARTNRAGDTPLHLASRWGYADIVALLIMHGSPLSVLNARGQTAAQVAHNVNLLDLLETNERAVASASTLASSQLTGSPAPTLASVPATATPLGPTSESVASPAVAARAPSSTASVVAAPTPEVGAPAGSSAKPGRTKLSSRFAKASSESLPPLANGPSRPPVLDRPASTTKAAAVPDGATVPSAAPVLRRTSSGWSKRVEQLFRAVEDGDITLVKFHLGLSDPAAPTTAAGVAADSEGDATAATTSAPETPVDRIKWIESQLCHPLCQCKEKCARLQEALLQASKGASSASPSKAATAGGAAGAPSGASPRRPLEPLSLQSQGSGGLTPLHVAAIHGQAAIVDLLLANHAVVDAVSDQGSTALHYAAAFDQAAEAALLLANGANPAARNSRGDTPLHLCKSLDVARLLLVAGGGRSVSASLEEPLTSGSAIVGVDPSFVNLVNSKGESALHAAARAGNPALCQLLMDAGADVTLRTIRAPFQTPAECAATSQIAQLLRPPVPSAKADEAAGAGPNPPQSPATSSTDADTIASSTHAAEPDGEDSPNIDDGGRVAPRLVKQPSESNISAPSGSTGALLADSVDSDDPDLVVLADGDLHRDRP